MIPHVQHKDYQVQKDALEEGGYRYDKHQERAEGGC